MVEEVSAADFLPTRITGRGLRAAASVCQGCELYKNATQTVFGQGSLSASLMLVGETPGDAEDREGKPFVGPAGRLLHESLTNAGLESKKVYITNVVKHFRWEPRGKRRLHKKPGARHVEACRPWIQAEILLIKPAIIVCLGATAAQALIGRNFKIRTQRGEILNGEEGARLMGTYHPAAILRAPDEHRRIMRHEFDQDIRQAARLIRRKSYKEITPRRDAPPGVQREDSILGGSLTRASRTEHLMPPSRRQRLASTTLCRRRLI